MALATLERTFAILLSLLRTVITSVSIGRVIGIVDHRHAQISGTIERLSEISSTIAAVVEEQGVATQEISATCGKQLKAPNRSLCILSMCSVVQLRPVWLRARFIPRHSRLPATVTA